MPSSFYHFNRRDLGRGCRAGGRRNGYEKYLSSCSGTVHRFDTPDTDSCCRLLASLCLVHISENEISHVNTNYSEAEFLKALLVCLFFNLNFYFKQCYIHTSLSFSLAFFFMMSPLKLGNDIVCLFFNLKFLF